MVRGKKEKKALCGWPIVKSGFSIIALTLSKGLPQRIYFTIFAQTLIKIEPKANNKGSLTYFYLKHNQRPTTKGVFLYFCSNLPKAYHKDYFYYSFAVTLTIGLTKTAFSSFCLNPNGRCTTEGVFLYFCPNPNQRPTTKGGFSIFTLTLTKNLPQRVSNSLLP